MEPAEIELFLSEMLAGRYRPHAHLGSGNFAGAFLTEDESTQQSVAAKIMRLSRCGDADATREFRDEVVLLKKLHGSDCIIELLDSGSHTVQLHHSPSQGNISVTTEFAVLELAAGSLADLILHGRSFGWSDRLRLYRDVVKGVHQMHRHRIVHRDVKAENVLVCDRPPRAKISDLGRAHDTGEPPRFVFEAYLCGRGDTRFAPFEFLWLQGTQEPDDQALADLYMLGSLLFELGTGVAFTSMVTKSPVAVINDKAALPEAARRRDWLASIPQLREATKLSLETFSAELPAAIAQRTAALVAQLTEAEPALRLPASRGRGPQRDAWDLQWLLDHIDALRRAIDPELRRRYISSRPRVKHGRQRARTP